MLVHLQKKKMAAVTNKKGGSNLIILKWFMRHGLRHLLSNIMWAKSISILYETFWRKKNLHQQKRQNMFLFWIVKLDVSEKVMLNQPLLLQVRDEINIIFLPFENIFCRNEYMVDNWKFKYNLLYLSNFKFQFYHLLCLLHYLIGSMFQPKVKNFLN